MGELQRIGYGGQPVPEVFRVVKPPRTVVVEARLRRPLWKRRQVFDAHIIVCLSLYVVRVGNLRET